ncbi:MAG: hypothetical protein KJO26_06165 [Deltaproteobacteria bacterium]|nr:hypothetical protein [Deltaproteobacteria bacterium]
MDTEFTKFSTNYVGVTVKLVEGTIFDGKINILPHKRLSDFINSRDMGFVIVIEGASSLEIQKKTVFINKNKVAWIEPRD